MTFIRNVNTVPQDTPFIDAAGRQRVSSPVPLIDLKHTKDKLPLFIDEVVIGGATSVHNVTNANVQMSVTNNLDAVIRQTFQRTNYQSGNSHFVECTFANIAPQTNVTKRVGYFSSNTTTPFNSNLDGLYLESSAGVVSVNMAKNGTITSITQSTWNIDKLDGTGASGITADWTKSQILFIDFLWLGVGRVRFGFNINGKNIAVHEFNTANIGSSVYMVSPNQPIRYEIRSTGGAGTFDQICATVRTEGDGVTLGYNTSVNTGTTVSNYATIGTRYAALGVRLKNTHFDVQTELQTISFLGTSNDDYRWEIIVNPTITGAFTYNGVTNSSLEFAIGLGTPTVTGGYIIASGYARQTTSINIPVNNLIKLGSSLAGVADTVVLTLTPISAGLTVYSSLIINEKV
jgi:hypothetical protein